MVIVTSKLDAMVTDPSTVERRSRIAPTVNVKERLATTASG
jgi:hypothetical protein